MAVVLVHGFSATKDDPAVVAVAEALADDGAHVVSYTARGHGESEGLCTLGDSEEHDVEAAADLVRDGADRVMVVGASMGAIAALRYAARADVGGLVTVSSPAEWRVPRTAQSALAAALTQTRPGRWIARRMMNVRLAPGWSGAASPVELAGSVQAPMAVVHGTGDRFIQPAEARKLYDAATGPRRLDLVSGMGHAYCHESVAVIREAISWAARGHLLPGIAANPTTP